MAALETIRKKGGVLISIIIGISLLAFIVGDFVPKGRNMDIVDINGEVITYQRYNALVEQQTLYREQQMGQALDERMKDMVREQTWQMMVNEEILNQEYAKAGITVSAEELFDWVQGPNPSPTIRRIQAFTNPQTGEFDRSIVINFLKNKDSDPTAAQQWLALEKDLIKERYYQKYNTLVSKGLYVPSFVVANENLELNKKVSFDYFTKAYSTVADSTIALKNSDIKKYYDEHREQWKQKASRDIEYVLFPVVPSDADRAEADKWMASAKTEFAESKDPEQYVSLNSSAPFDGKFYKKDQLPIQVVGLFDAAVGTLEGPYAEDEVLKLARLLKVEERPDSIKVQQIIIVPKSQTDTQQSLTARADSIKQAIEKGANFGELALRYSADPSAATNKGEIGWIQESSAAYGSIYGSYFDAKTGEVLKHETQQGILIERIAERGQLTKKVQIATLQHNIIASQHTDDMIFALASKFAMENRDAESFNATVAAEGLNKRSASYIAENDQQITGLTSARAIVRWAFGLDNNEQIKPASSVGDISEGVFRLPDSYAVAMLTKIRKEGYADIKDVQSDIAISVRREKKAAELSNQLAEAANGAASLGDLAVKLNLPVESATDISFQSFSVPGAGIEPDLIATATAIDENTISKPVDGNNGVFVLSVKQETLPTDSTMLEAARSRLSATYMNRSLQEAIQAVRNASKVKDMRSNFY